MIFRASKNRRWIGLFATVVTAAAGIFIGGRVVDAIAAHGDGDGSPPRLEIGTSEHDFGVVQSGTPLDERFPVANRGGGRLILYETNGSCGCIRTDRAVIIIPAGGTHALTPHLETAGLAGPLKLEVRYKTNDPSHSELKLFLLVNVQRH